MNKKHKPSVDYDEELISSLKDHNEAVAYLNAALEESFDGQDESQEVLLRALRQVAEAQGGLGKLAKKTHIRREVLYRVLSSEGNPALKTFTNLVHAMGLNLRFC